MDGAVNESSSSPTVQSSSQQPKGKGGASTGGKHVTGGRQTPSKRSGMTAASAGGGRGGGAGVVTAMEMGTTPSPYQPPSRDEEEMELYGTGRVRRDYAPMPPPPPSGRHSVYPPTQYAPGGMLQHPPIVSAHTTMPNADAMEVGEEVREQRTMIAFPCVCHAFIHRMCPPTA